MAEPVAQLDSAQKFLKLGFGALNIIRRDMPLSISGKNDHCLDINQFPPLARYPIFRRRNEWIGPATTGHRHRHGSVEWFNMHW